MRSVKRQVEGFGGAVSKGKRPEIAEFRENKKGYYESDK